MQINTQHTNGTQKCVITLSVSCQCCAIQRHAMLYAMQPFSHHRCAMIVEPYCAVLWHCSAQRHLACTTQHLEVGRWALHLLLWLLVGGWICEHWGWGMLVGGRRGCPVGWCVFVLLRVPIHVLAPPTCAPPPKYLLGAACWGCGHCCAADSALHPWENVVWSRVLPCENVVYTMSCHQDRACDPWHAVWQYLVMNSWGMTGATEMIVLSAHTFCYQNQPSFLCSVCMQRVYVIYIVTATWARQPHHTACTFDDVQSRTNASLHTLFSH